MKILMVATCVLMFCFSPSHAPAQSCKPDSSGKDSISKQQVDRWYQSLYSTGFGSSLMNTSQISIVAIVGRYGTANSISIQIQKQEESKQNATFESEYHAVKGNQFYFGLRNGEPLAFVATEVSNQTKAGGVLVGKMITTVILAATVQDKDLAALRDALTRKQIDAVRIILAGDVQIQKAVNDKDGKKMMEKFSCFYQSLDMRGIDLSAGAGPQGQPVQPASPSDASVPGKYVRRDKSSDYIELNTDGTFSLQQDGKGYRGNYAVQADTITIQVSNAPASRLRISGNTMVESDGTVWEKQAEPQKSAAATQLTNEQIIQMVAAKLPDDVIIATIRKSGSKFDLTSDALIKLKTAGVSDAVLRAMMQ
jgi:hypothetical protein